VADLYVRRLDDIEGLVLPVAADWAEPIWHLFVVRHAQRDALQERLSDAGVTR
jgi:dTDP-4-amino-4,6-dideoxygalactose transaminase